MKDKYEGTTPAYIKQEILKAQIMIDEILRRKKVADDSHDLYMPEKFGLEMARVRQWMSK